MPGGPMTECVFAGCWNSEGFPVSGSHDDPYKRYDVVLILRVRKYQQKSGHAAFCTLSLLLPPTTISELLAHPFYAALAYKPVKQDRPRTELVGKVPLGRWHTLPRHAARCSVCKPGEAYRFLSPKLFRMSGADCLKLSSHMHHDRQEAAEPNREA